MGFHKQPHKDTTNPAGQRTLTDYYRDKGYLLEELLALIQRAADAMPDCKLRDELYDVWKRNTAGVRK